MKVVKELPGIVVIVMIAIACSGRKPESVTTVSSTTGTAVPGPSVKLYQLHGEWHNNVPVTLTDDGSSIVAYPSPTDVRKMEKPVKLKDGWWMDVRMINKNTAFLDMEMKDYGALKQSMSLENMMSHIVSKKPFVRLYDCGVRDKSKDQADEFMKRIDGDKLSGCKCQYGPEKK